MAWAPYLGTTAARDEVMAAVAETRGIVVTGVDERTVVAHRRYLPTWALVTALGLALFTGGISLLLLLWRSEESFVLVVDIADGGTRVVMRGTLHPEAVERVSERLGVAAVRV